VLERVQKLCDAAHQALWLGVLDSDQWQELTDQYYKSTRSASGTRNYFGKAHNLKGFFQWELAAIDAHFADCKSMLVGSAGGGREVLALARRNVKVDAFECGPELAESCRALLASQGVEATVVTARPNEVPDSLGVYDGAILGWGAYTHVVGRDRRIGFLKDMHRHLKPGSLLLVSFFRYKDAWFPGVTYQVARAIRTLRWARPHERGDSIGNTFNHRFTEAQIREELRIAGFDVVLYSETGFGHAVARAVGRAGEGQGVVPSEETRRPEQEAIAG
jgi:hypothetical protein